MSNIFIITIDGPSGSGKGSIAARIAQHYQFNLLDSGALYRIIGLAAEQENVLTPNTLEASKIALLASQVNIEFKTDTNLEPVVLLNQRNITLDIRHERVGILASKVATIPEVRTALLNRQRAFAKSPGLVADVNTSSIQLQGSRIWSCLFYG